MTVADIRRFIATEGKLGGYVLVVKPKPKPKGKP